MNELKAPSLQSLLESDRGSTDSLQGESLPLDFDDLDDAEFAIPTIDTVPTLESVLSELEGDSDVLSEAPNTAPTPTPSLDEGLKGGTILRHVILQGVSLQISSVADRGNAGSATAVAVSQNIAIGTSHGLIMHFDCAQILRWGYQDENSQGAVSSLSYNEDCLRLLAGFARGVIIMIDTTNGDVLRTLHDAITPNTGVLSLKWTGRPALALVSDSGGSVWSLSFTRKLGIRGFNSRCLFSGARGEVCAMEPLILEDDSHELRSNCIIALATLSKYFIVTIRPRLKVIKYHVLNGPPNCLPLLAWHMVLIQAADTSRTVDPVLAVARGNQLYFHQILINNGRINLLFLRHLQLSVNLLAVHWLGPKSLACVDTAEMLHLIDVRTSKVQECIDMASAGLVYGSAQFKGLATGGNVSPALAFAGSHACYNSIVTRGTQLYILGSRSLHMVSMRNWNERISYLVRNYRWVEACELAIEGYKSAGDRPRRKKQARDRIIELFKEYISSHNRLPEFSLPSMLKCLIEINELDLLWQDLWDKLNSPALFLTLITEHIENDDITKVSPTIAQALVDYWINLSPHKMEEIILKLDWSCLDLHQVLTAAKKNKLYRAQIYLNTHALGDYSVSLTELIPLIEKEDRNLGNCILVYISSCLAGRGYPTGDIPAESVQDAKHEILRCLTSIHSNNSEENELSYPYLRILLKFDTRETLNVISLAFQEKDFSGELGVSHRQRIINILIEVMTPESATLSQIGCLFNFISQQIATKCLPDHSSLLHRVMTYLTREDIEGETSRQHNEREQAWMELITTDCLDHIPDGEHIEMARKSKCYTVVEYLLEKTKRYDEILESYLNSPNRHSEMFAYIVTHAKRPERKIFFQLCKYLPQVLDIDLDRTAKIIADNYSEHADELIPILKGKPRFTYLLQCYLYRYCVNFNTENSESYLDLLCSENPEWVILFLSNHHTYRIEKALEIVSKYNLVAPRIYLFEKQGNFQQAFDLSLDLVKNATEGSGQEIAIQTCGLCSRASEVLSKDQREEFWFPFLNIILSRPDISAITKHMLHAASQYVDLSKLVQLVLNSGTQSGYFGDIKHLLVGMLSNARYETLLAETTARILGHDLHGQFAKNIKDSKRGMWVTLVKCVVCRQKLCNQTDVLVFGTCGHCMHDNCAKDYRKPEGFICPRCGEIVTDVNPVKLAEPSLQIFKNSLSNNSDWSNLQLKAPPRKF